MDENIQTSCTCDRQTPAPHAPQHILLDCIKYKQHRHLLKPVAQNLEPVVGGTIHMYFFSFIAIGSISLMIYNNNINNIGCSTSRCVQQCRTSSEGPGPAPSCDETLLRPPYRSAPAPERPRHSRDR